MSAPLNSATVDLMNEFREYYKRNPYEHFNIYSRRQDIGITKCEFGVAHGFLKREEITDASGQSTRWLYTFTEKAKEYFRDY